MENLSKHFPEIIKAAAGSPLGVVALEGRLLKLESTPTVSLSVVGLPSQATTNKITFKTPEAIAQDIAWVAIKRRHELSPREQRLLYFIAQQIDVVTPWYKFNGAAMSLSVGDADSAIVELQTFLNNPKDSPPHLIEEAKVMLKEAQTMKANPRPAITPVKPNEVLQLDNNKLILNLLNAMRDSGVLKDEDADRLLFDSRADTNQPPPSVETNHPASSKP
jgi:hypothetical protein